MMNKMMKRVAIAFTAAPMMIAGATTASAKIRRIIKGMDKLEMTEEM